MRSDPSPEEIQELLAKLTPPKFPDEVFDARDPHMGQIADWKKSTTSSVIAGLLTDPRFHANTIRLEWLQRLVLSKSNGRRKPQPRDLSAVLNDGLGHAGVLRLEDPIEDLFCDRISTVRGDFRIFFGVWESAGAYTQTLLDAFESLPAGGLKDQALESAYALLQLSEALAARAGVDRSTTSSGAPAGEFSVPSADDLKRLARRVRFSDSDLVRLSINKNALTPFLLQAGHAAHVALAPRGHAVAHPVELAGDLAVELVALDLLLLERRVAPRFERGEALLETARAAAIA